LSYISKLAFTNWLSSRRRILYQWKLHVCLERGEAGCSPRTDS